MRTKRQAKILEIIEQEPMTTQEELLERLRSFGFEVTQATISRDIKYLRLVKTLDKEGIYRYTVLKSETPTDTNDRNLSILRDTVIEVDRAENIVVLKCYTGMANAACASLDSMGLSEIVGTISGDDTFFVLLRTVEQAINFQKTIAQFLFA